MTELQKRTFITEILHYILKYAPQYNIKYVSPIIAQACIESRFGDSGLSRKAHNYFGMKCGKGYKGASINMKTMEEYTKGSLTQISANFRSYANMEEGVKGYFEFIQARRYQNLKNAISADDYCEKIKADGWATSYSYVQTLKKTMDAYNLREYDSLVGTVANGGVVTVNNKPVANKTVTYNPVTQELVKAVIRGDYGNGAARKAKLEKAGYNYTAVRAAVNKALR